MMQEHVFSVAEFTTLVKEVVNEIPLFRNVSVVGEISNFNAHRSGHFYFSLKDEMAVMSAVMFRTRANTVKFKPKNGDKVIIRGRFEYYQPYGTLQFYVDSMNLDGLGDLYIQYEMLKKIIFDNGWHDEKYKQSIPKYPHTIGVVCGSNSAAYADITRTLHERWPLAKQVDFLAYVQGELAPKDLVDKITEANESGVDVIVLARGGGSIEDLWAFNELMVVEAVFNSKVAIVSGIGHESDTTLVDYVSDYRAATPTAAASYVTPNRFDVQKVLRDYKNNFYVKTLQKLKQNQVQLQNIVERRHFKVPESLLDNAYFRMDLLNQKFYRQTTMFTEYVHKLDGIQERLTHAMQIKLLDSHNDSVVLYERNHLNISRKLEKTAQELGVIDREIVNQGHALVSLKKRDFSDILRSMKHLSPFNIMLRGYGAIFLDDKSVRSIDDVRIGDRLKVVIRDGEVMTEVLERKTKNGRED